MCYSICNNSKRQQLHNTLIRTDGLFFYFFSHINIFYCYLYSIIHTFCSYSFFENIIQTPKPYTEYRNVYLSHNNISSKHSTSTSTYLDRKIKINLCKFCDNYRFYLTLLYGQFFCRGGGSCRSFSSLFLLTYRMSNKNKKKMNKITQ